MRLPIFLALAALPLAPRAAMAQSGDPQGSGPIVSGIQTASAVG